MSEKENPSLNEKEQDSEDEQVENIGVGSTTLDNTIQMSDNRSKIADLQHLVNEGTEVDPSDVMTVEQLSHESLRENPIESSECKVIYEFPSDNENKNVDHLSQACVNPPHKIPGVTSGHAEYSSILQIASEQKEKLIKIFETNLNDEVADNSCIAGTSRESERKRKQGPFSLIQSKRCKEIQSSTNPVIHSPRKNEDIVRIKCSDDSSDEFADIEDNVKDVSSSENSDWNSTSKTSNETSPNDLGIQQGNKIENENKYVKSNYESSSSNSDYCKNNKPVDSILFPPSLKGETIPIILSDEMKKKFELPMPPIFEVRESESDEQVIQPKTSKPNPLKMRAKVVKRKNKCNVCNVKLGLCAIKCRCGGYYCAKHRYDREHNCTFDYKSMGAEEIQKNNPRIVAEKVRKL